MLREIPELPLKLEWVNARDCVSLERFSRLSNILERKECKMICRMDLSNCHRLYSNLAHDVAKKKNIIHNEVESLCSLFLIYQQYGFRVVFSGSEVPKWFHCKQDVKDMNFSWQYATSFGFFAVGNYEFYFKILQNLNWFNTGLAFCGVVAYTQNTIGSSFLTARVRINEDIIEHQIQLHSTEIESDEVWLHYTLFSTIFLNGGYSWPHLWDQVFAAPVNCRVSLEYCSRSHMRFKSFGVHLVTPHHEDTVSVEEVHEDVGTSAGIMNEHNDDGNVGNIEDLKDEGFFLKNDEEHHLEPPEILERGRPANFGTHFRDKYHLRSDIKYLNSKTKGARV
ncbi:uncharacterized protein LOC126784786 [Argentina anserina]|uniref:uncharacterized protein LOC126784786 n=1 Tax=Argentina anserina TaxID=57926 RepID=UPI0021762225|nr:uncharacterized protein LOC126784786 [Potentilla anserina]XP_050366252.1 uncharacterized protein LOC126784786 [Potentilla anserina]XP_050366253.1 uncharacterized protein LOC126784786 [Potentilla anserina]